MNTQRAKAKPNNSLHQLVMGDVARIGATSEKRFAKRVVDEINHSLLEVGIHGIERRFALEKVRDDLEQNYSAKHEELVGKNSREKYLIIEPTYMHQLLDPEVADELISVWLERMIDGSLAIPSGLPAALGQWLVRNDREWAEINLEPTDPNRNMLNNRVLFSEVLRRCNLI